MSININFMTIILLYYYTSYVSCRACIVGVLSESDITSSSETRTASEG